MTATPPSPDRPPTASPDVSDLEARVKRTRHSLTPPLDEAYVKPRYRNGVVAYRVNWCDPDHLDETDRPRACSITLDDPDQAETLANLLNENGQKLAAVTKQLARSGGE